MNRDGTMSILARYLRTAAVMTTKRTAATSHSISTCLVTDILTPKTVGRWING